jgi:uncharacterized protein (TIGR00297 family)
LTDLWLLVILLSLAGLSILSYALRALDLLGAVASFFLGLEVALLGGVRWLALMTLFPVLGVVATRIGHRRKKAMRVAEPGEGERGVGNVLGNGLAAALVALALLLDPVPRAAAAIAFTTAVAAVTADTLASEIGVLAARARSILPPFARAPVGDNGAVSLLGQASALVGAVAIGAGAILLLHLGWAAAAVAAAAGFIGCQIDSVLGATLEGNDGKGRLTKQDVNFLAGAIPAFLVLVVATFAL